MSRLFLLLKVRNQSWHLPIESLTTQDTLTFGTPRSVRARFAELLPGMKWSDGNAQLDMGHETAEIAFDPEDMTSITLRLVGNGPESILLEQVTTAFRCRAYDAQTGDWFSPEAQIKIVAWQSQVLRSGELMPKPQTLLALNWKMNKTPSQAVAWAQELSGKLPASSAALAIMAPATSLQGLAWFLKDSPVMLGAQDISAHESGAYTGEISAAMLLDVGAKYAVVGHSERREYHAETSQVVAGKARAAKQAGLIPIICVGEGLEVRERGEHVAYTLDMLRDSLAGLTIASADQIVVAYEPVWAIGTGKTATAADAEELCAAIRGALSGLLGEVASGVRVLYGGSVKGSNIAEICGQPNVNGALVGGAALEVASVLEMVNALA